MPLVSSGDSGKICVCNESEASVVLESSESKHMLSWEFPKEIAPKGGKAEVSVKFDTGKSKEEAIGKAIYRVLSVEVDNKRCAGDYLGSFHITADAKNSTPLKFEGNILLDWASVQSAFGLALEPGTGKYIHKLSPDTPLCIKISGKPLPGGPRDEKSEIKLGEWKSWAETAPKCEFGDVVGVDRGPIRHYGVIYKKGDGGEVRIIHLTGTAEDVLQTHGLSALKEVGSALRPESSGGIAVVTIQTLEEFAAGDPCRIENALDDKRKAFVPETVLARMDAAFGFRHYSLFQFNCEHFANYLRYGMPYSAQVEAITEKFNKGLDLGNKKKELDSKIQAHLDGASKDFEAARASLKLKADEAGEKIKAKMDSIGQKLPGKH